jgi:hypothetical protein
MAARPIQREPEVYLDTGASHHQLNPEKLRELGDGVPRELKTRINGVNADAPIFPTKRGVAYFPLMGEHGNTTHAVRLEEVLSGEQITGPGFMSVGRLTVDGYAFMSYEEDYFIFDSNLELVKRV